MFLWGDWTIILLVPVLLLSVYLNFKVKGTFKKFNKIKNSRNITGSQMAKLLLEQNGLSHVKVEPTSGMLSDHYDPQIKTVKLSENNFHNNSIAAVTIAAHEVGHAIQDNKNYAPLTVRSAIYPIAGLGSSLAFPMFIIGLIFSFPFLLNLGILFFAGAVLFHVVTLPVEFDASRRALAHLSSNNLLLEDEMIPARKILSAAALTYVAATLMAIMNLIRMLILKSQYDD
ncbi:MAG: zinc metallopeptidase [Calditrichia bacterium]|nr:zinc metallopeptidase [Calditrichia bacterium]